VFSPFKLCSGEVVIFLCRVKERSAVGTGNAQNASEKTAVPPEESNEVLRRATAAVQDPDCDATAQVVALHVLTRLSDGEPLSWQAYQAAIKHNTPITKRVPMDGELQNGRELLVELMMLRKIETVFWERNGDSQRSH
jgi:hypothetical protein